MSDFENQLADLLPTMRVWARSRVRGTPYESQDLVQETALRAFRHQDTFDGSNMLGWVSTIMRNTVIEWLRSQKNRPTLGGGDPSSREEPAIDPSQENHLILLETVGRMRRLSGPHAAAMGLVVGQGLNYEAAGRRLGLLPDTVKSQVHRARKILSDD